MLARRWSSLSRGTAVLLALLALLPGLLLTWPFNANAGADVLVVGSKRFTESYILGEIVRESVAPVVKAEHRRGLGNTAIVFAALRAGEVDLYPEYLGTLEREILKHDTGVPLAQLQQELARLGLGLGPRLGFSNGYALAMPAQLAERENMRSLSDLAKHPALRLGLSHEFLGRVDGYPGLSQAYGLRNPVQGLDHGLAYQALAAGRIDVIDIYSTDARIQSMGLRVLQDDRAWFPRYDAVLVYRLDLPRRFPAAWQKIEALQGHIDGRAMIAMNAAAELDGRDFASIAKDFLAGRYASSEIKVSAGSSTTRASKPAAGFMQKLFGPDFWRLAGQHVWLVGASVLLAILLGLPLGVAAARLPRLGGVLMPAVGVLQTIPSLALLAMLIPLLGRIGSVPAIIALFLYALLPIVANTASGMAQVPRGLRQAALSLGLSARDRLLSIELPLCALTILAGIRTATVINIGTATIAAFIGAGGFGERIATGLALNDNAMLLAGALPAAALALLAQGGFYLLEQWLARPMRPR